MKSNPYDLIFLDIELPRMNGVAVGKYIRESLNNETVQIAYISSKQQYAMDIGEDTDYYWKTAEAPCCWHSDFQIQGQTGIY